ncbi:MULTISPECIES: hypothetical protein [unclassified Lysobacter]|uniref:hypothetical protein n=1 Tax=unclassified Lysobacter TaxID=2635362 RepID=UPI001C21454E|nr:hypothetical protein [Lysobacter sp. MMG2]MBU8977359.1 hypothetical protein [Lysobacter sp. MMG2]
MDNGRRGIVPLFCLLVMAGSVHAGSRASDDGTCWKAVFHEQLSGEVREKTSSGGPYGYTYSYEGDFRWVGEPKAAPVAQEFVFCFRERLDDGGTLTVGGKRIELGRVGSVKLPPLLHETASYSYTSARDDRDFPTLYGSFSTPGKPDSSLEIQLDRIRKTVTVVARTVNGDKPVASFMQGEAAPVER